MIYIGFTIVLLLILIVVILRNISNYLRFIYFLLYFNLEEFLKADLGDGLEDLFDGKGNDEYMMKLEKELKKNRNI
ncbi:MAG: hypothetical protein ABF289_18430 [Clostridiales bacterium]